MQFKQFQISLDKPQLALGLRDLPQAEKRITVQLSMFTKSQLTTSTRTF